MMLMFSGRMVLFSGTMQNALGGGELELLETWLGDDVIVIPEPRR